MANLATLIENENIKRRWLRNQIRWIKPDPIRVNDQDEVSFVPTEQENNRLKDSVNPWKV